MDLYYIVNLSRCASDPALDSTLREIHQSITALAAHLAIFESNVMTSNAQLTQDMVDLTNQLAKAKTEIVGRIAALEAALANDNISPASEAALADLKGEVQVLDDLNTDAVVEPPPVDPTPTP